MRRTVNPRVMDKMHMKALELGAVNRKFDITGDRCGCREMSAVE